MAQPSIVSTWEGIKDYPKNNVNALMILASGIALTACIIDKTRDLTQYPALENMNSILSKFFFFADVGLILKTVPELWENWTAYLAKTTGDSKKSVEQIRNEDHINFPQGNPHRWIGLRTAALLALIFSKVVSAHNVLHGIGAIKIGSSSMFQVLGAGTGAAACVLNIAETRRACAEVLLDRKTGETLGDFVSDHKLDQKLRDADKNQFHASLNTHRRLLCGNRLQAINSKHTVDDPTWDPRTWNQGSWGQLSDGILCVMKIASLFAALHKVAGVVKPFNDVAKWVAGNANNLFGGLFATYVLVNWAGHAMVDASIKELEKRYVEPPKGGN